MVEPRTYYTEWSKSERERQILYINKYEWNLKKIIQMKLLTKQKQTHRLREWTYDYQAGKEVGRDTLRVGIDIYSTAIFKIINQQGTTI